MKQTGVIQNDTKDQLNGIKTKVKKQTKRFYKSDQNIFVQTEMNCRKQAIDSAKRRTVSVNRICETTLAVTVTTLSRDHVKSSETH